MNNQDKNTGNKTQDKLLEDLYQHANHEQPPQAIDDLIHAKAKQSTQTIQGQQTSKSNKSLGRWKPWLAAASVVLVIPMIWLFTQNPALTDSASPLDDMQEPRPQSSENRAPAARKTMTEDMLMVDEIEAQALDTDKDQIDSPKITVSGLRIKTQDAAAPAPMVDYQEVIEQQGERSISGRPIDYESLNANKTKLKAEFKTKKRTIKPSTMGPLMALEYEQFGRYLTDGEIEKADKLLTEMQENWPDFDFEDMIYRLAEAEIKGQ